LLRLLRILSIPADPELTDIGKEQAKNVNRMWKKEIESGIPLPEKLYCSPMTRAIQTNQITFDGAVDRAPFIVEVRSLQSYPLLSDALRGYRPFRRAENTAVIIPVINESPNPISSPGFPMLFLRKVSLR
jgi:hypothetical protein